MVFHASMSHAERLTQQTAWFGVMFLFESNFNFSIYIFMQPHKI